MPTCYCGLEGIIELDGELLCYGHGRDALLRGHAHERKAA